MWSGQDSVWGKLCPALICVSVEAEVFSWVQSALCCLPLPFQGLPAELQVLLKDTSVTVKNR